MSWLLISDLAIFDQNLRFLIKIWVFFVLLISDLTIFARFFFFSSWSQISGFLVIFWSKFVFFCPAELRFAHFRPFFDQNSRFCGSTNRKSTENRQILIKKWPKISKSEISWTKKPKFWSKFNQKSPQKWDQLDKKNPKKSVDGRTPSITN